jgi:hypothetical protein
VRREFLQSISAGEKREVRRKLVKSISACG